MSKFIPMKSVVREQEMQYLRRSLLEKRFANEIESLKIKLLTVASVVEDLMQLGLTARHAINLNGRLQFINQLEEQAKNEEPPVVDPDAIQAEATAPVEAVDP